jgi:hypothetical protein
MADADEIARVQTVLASMRAQLLNLSNGGTAAVSRSGRSIQSLDIEKLEKLITRYEWRLAALEGRVGVPQAVRFENPKGVGVVATDFEQTHVRPTL